MVVAVGASTCSPSGTCAIRAKYLATLGISPPRPQNTNQPPSPPRKFALLGPTMTGRAAATAAARRDAKSAPISLSLRPKEPLLVQNDEVSIRVHVHATIKAALKKSLPPKTSITITPSPRVQFQAAVTVKEIPSHRDYDKADRRNVWNSTRVLEQNAQRNAFEYWAEGQDWRNACEEEQMIRTRKGKLVHPATWHLIHENLAQQKRQDAFLHRQR